MVVSIRDMRRTLLYKFGFKQSNSHHYFYDLSDKDGKIVAKTKLSHDPQGSDISKKIFSCIAKQIYLTNPQLVDAVKCPLSLKNYSDILKAKGIISSDLPQISN